MVGDGKVGSFPGVLGTEGGGFICKVSHPTRTGSTCAETSPRGEIQSSNPGEGIMEMHVLSYTTCTVQYHLSPGEHL